MRSRRTLVYVGIAVVLLLNVTAIWWRLSHPRVRTGSEKQEQARRLERQTRRLGWEEFPVVALDSPNLEEQVRRIKEGTCIPLRKGRQSVALSEAPNQVVEGLYDTLYRFLRAYRRVEGKSPARAVVAFMNSCGMEVDRARTEWMLTELPKLTGATRNEYKDLDPDDLYIRYWEAMPESSTSMQGIVVEPSCIRLWRGPANVVDQLVHSEDLSAWVSSLWQGIATRLPMFKPSGPLGCGGPNRDSTTLVADVQIILNNDGVIAEGKSPYLLRLKYDSACDKWQPVALVAVLLDEVQIKDNFPF